MVRRIGLIVQAHMGSERLPGKILKKVKGISILGHVILRLKRVSNADIIIVATSNLKQDDVVITEAQKYGVLTFRGDDRNVLSRYYLAAKEYEVSDIARICSDNMFIDPEIVEHEINVYLQGKHDLVTSGKSIPLGLGTEVFSFKNLELACKNASTEYEYEHVCPYIYDHGTIKYCEIDSNNSKLRLTLDTIEDWKFINELAERLDSVNCNLNDIKRILQKEPELLKINENVVQRL